jgi:aspartyl-tRNA(Asn)/glutamyl-tRNA(Gln) amidotransferase subunit A
MDLYQLTAARMVQGIKDKKFSALEVLDSCLSRAHSMESVLNAVITFSEEKARENAIRVDKAIADGEDPGLLAGVPVLVKDNMCTDGVRTTCASRILGEWEPPYNATVVDLLRRQGATVTGKTNMDEFAMGSSSEHSAFGACHNPWDYDRVTGGSSGGSAASVAAGYVPLSLGSDTGGSVRQPAGFCGIYGLKPTYGLVSRYGLIAFASSLDQIGPFARTMEDIALGMNVITEPDNRDSTCSRRERPDYTEALRTENLKGKKVGVVREFQDHKLDPDIHSAVERTLKILEGEGAEIVEVSLPVTMDSGLGAYYILAPAEASSNLARYDGVRYGYSAPSDDLLSLYFKTRKEGFGTEVKRRILTGTYVLSSGYYDAYYLTAQKVRQVITKEFNNAFEEVDSIVMPTSPSPAFKIGELLSDPIQMYMMDVFTLPVNLAGLPGLSINAGFSSEGLPLGVQLVGPKWKETDLISQGSILEKTFGPARIAEGGAKQ